MNQGVGSAMRGQEVLVAMSGGVDSAVAAALLQEQGYRVRGVFLCLGQAGGADPSSKGCCSPEDAADARLVADRLGIDLHVLNAGEDFRGIIDDFVNEYANGRTPNPCVLCNVRIKFARLLRHADALGIPWVATGHYARIDRTGARAALLRKKTRQKDQSYVLFGLSPDILSRVLFPLGEMDSKDDVRAIARRLGFKVHDKPDSQEVCFVPDDDTPAFLRSRRPDLFTRGAILDAQGRVLGHHTGFAAYTIGQRRGLGIAARDRLYVTEIRADRREVVLGSRDDLLRGRLVAARANWQQDVSEEFEAIVQIRYSHVGTPARIKLLENGRFEAHFHEPVHSVTPGQVAVCYDGDRLLGGGWIEATCFK